ncbi:phosphoenolpyruvate carboxylase [bacterium]|nr:phosphoenolpyruvate carboxylase [bacterium]
MSRGRRTIPKTMSTQHPDNARMPDFAAGEVFTGEEEIFEAYFAYSELDCREQMWDWEGKEVDPLVIEKLLMRYQDFFKVNPIGERFFLTPRVPNPSVEPVDGARLPQILHNIIYSSLIAKIFYEREIVPVFEIILPMTTSVKQLNRLEAYYRNFVSGQALMRAFPEDDMLIKEWLGDFKPERIGIIPLFEDKDSLLNCDKIVEAFMEGKKLEYMRVFLGRSDPALNYSNLSSVLFLNVALQRLYRLEKRSEVPIYPILGVGSAPFRGNFKPTNVDSMLKGYASCHTFTLQSSFKYDWPKNMVRKAVKKINSAKRGEPMKVDEKRSIELGEKSAKAYQEQIPELVPLIEEISPFVPRRRLRKLHFGLFGYARGIGNIKLPRAIGFCASLYSIGLPPEILGLHCLDKDDLAVIKDNYPWENFHEDMIDALAFYNPLVLTILPLKIKENVEKALRFFDFQINEEHRDITTRIISILKNGKRNEELSELIVQAARIRRFLG